MDNHKPVLVQRGIIGEWQFANWTDVDTDGVVYEWYTWCSIEDELRSDDFMHRSLGEAMINAVAHAYLGDGEDAWGQACSFARMIGMHVAHHDGGETEWVWQAPPIHH